MTIAARLHKAGDGKWWYAPLTLVSYCLMGTLCFWETAVGIYEGRVSYLFGLTRLFGRDFKSIVFSQQPISFTLFSILGVVTGIFVYWLGWQKFASRRRRHSVNAKRL